MDFKRHKPAGSDDNDVVPMGCRQPKAIGQAIITQSGPYRLDEENSRLVVVNNVLSEEIMTEYLQHAKQVVRFGGKTGHGQQKPRLELCYTPNGNVYKYSGQAHITTTYPSHVLAILPSLLAAVSNQLGGNEFTVLSNGIDIRYDATQVRGGSIGAHGDTENKAWGLVIIYTLGQTRWLRVRNRQTKEWHNVRMAHNSLIAMHGTAFQRNFTHQVDKLNEKEPIGVRLSLNVRFLKAPLNEEQPE